MLPEEEEGDEGGGRMKERKSVTIPADVIMDPLLTDSEFRLLARLSLKFGTGETAIDDKAIASLGMPKSTVYRLIGRLLKREYLQRNPQNGLYSVSVSNMRLSSLKYEKNQSQKWEKEKEKERSKEKDRDSPQDSIYIYNNKGVTENDKEREIQKREKAGENGDAGKPEKAVRKSKPFVKPTVEEVLAYCRERKSTVSAQAFVDFYESKGWMVGKNHMKDWKAAVRTWEQKDKADGRYFVPAENQSTPDDDYPF